MPAAKRVSELEKDLIRLGLKKGLKPTQIAKKIGRSKKSVYEHIAKMRAGGTLNNAPFDFMDDESGGNE